MCEAVADVGLQLDELRLSGCRHALAHQVTACLHCCLQPVVGSPLRVLSPRDSLPTSLSMLYYML